MLRLLAIASRLASESFPGRGTRISQVLGDAQGLATL